MPGYLHEGKPASHVNEKSDHPRRLLFRSIFGANTILKSCVSSAVFAVLLLLFILTSIESGMKASTILGIIACAGLLISNLVSLAAGLKDRRQK